MTERESYIELLKQMDLEFSASEKNVGDSIGTISRFGYEYQVELMRDYEQKYIVLHDYIPMKNEEQLSGIADEINERFITGKCRVENGMIHIFIGFALVDNGLIYQQLLASMSTMCHMRHGCEH